MFVIYTYLSPYFPLGRFSWLSVGFKSAVHCDKQLIARETGKKVILFSFCICIWVLWFALLGMKQLIYQTLPKEQWIEGIEYFDSSSTSFEILAKLQLGFVRPKRKNFDIQRNTRVASGGQFTLNYHTPSHNFLIELLSEEVWLNCYCWGNSNMVEGRFSKWF